MNKMWASVVAFGLCAGAAGAEDTIRIGLMAPLTGSFASEGQEMKQVVDLLAGEVNAKGGLLGKKVDLITEDDGSDPRTASLAAQRLVTRGVIAVIGTYGSAVTEASQRIFDESKILQVANGSTAIRLSEKGMKYFFRTCPRDDEQGKVAVDAIRKSKAGKVAILHDNSTYAKGLAEEIRGPLQAEDVRIVFFDALTKGDRDYTAILTKMKAAGAERVFFTGYYQEAGLLLKQRRQMKWEAPFLGGDATNNPDLVKIAGKEAAAGFAFVSPLLPQDLPSKQAKEFLAAFRRKYRNDPASIYSVLAGDGFNAVAAAVASARTTDADKLAEHLKTKFREPHGLTGALSFNAKGDRVGQVYCLYEVDAEGKFVLRK